MTEKMRDAIAALQAIAPLSPSSGAVEAAGAKQLPRLVEGQRPLAICLTPRHTS